MFGYVRPNIRELKVKDNDSFKACYCTLCHALKKKYRLSASLILNYDFVFLAMLLDDGDPKSQKCRCVVNPCKKKACFELNDAYMRCAGYSVILTWWKLIDSLADDSFFGRLKSRFIMLLLKRSYKTASAELPEFDSSVRAELSALAELEKSGGDSLDAASDLFARILGAIGQDSGLDEKKSRVLEQVLYHLGRWIYIVDACDDLKEDHDDGRYNPVAARFSIEDGVLNDDAKERIRTTLLHSRNIMGASFELLDKSVWTDIIRNIIYFGMPEVANAVLSGKWKNTKLPG